MDKQKYLEVIELQQKIVSHMNEVIGVITELIDIEEQQ